MADIKKKPCLICGKYFKPCSTITSGLNWRRLFCSEECCREWMRRQNSPMPVEKQPEEPVVQEVSEEIPVEEPVVVEETAQEVVKPARKTRRKAAMKDE